MGPRPQSTSRASPTPLPRFTNCARRPLRPCHASPARLRRGRLCPHGAGRWEVESRAKGPTVALRSRGRARPAHLHRRRTRAFHRLLFTRWKTKTERFWKATDYWWLGIAVVGLWGVAERYEQQRSNDRIHEQEVMLEREYTAQQGWIVTLMNTQMHAALIKIEGNPHKEAIVRRDVSQHIFTHSLYTSLQQAMNFHRPYNKHQGELESVIRNIESDRYGKPVATEMRLLLKRAIPEEERLDRLRTDAARSFFGHSLAYSAPLLLAVALALRLTRVTAEVFVLRGPAGSRESAGSVV